MKNKSNLSDDELRQKVDGFSMKHNDNDEKNIKDGYKIVDVPLYQSHSADYERIKKGK